MKFIIVGLGNIGAEYEHTRHNIGFDVLDEFAKKHGVVFNVDRHAYKAEVKIKGKTFILLKPVTYMNLSGKAVKHHLQQEKTELSQILIITDDLALPVGKIRIKPKGSDGGHNGLKSINEHLTLTEYPRMRIGIGSDFSKGRQSDYVLGKWKADEEPIIVETIGKAVDAIEEFALAGIQNAMNKFNQ
jgi:peptidyl-tRNA hydrolase, PTH1 family